MYMSRNKGFLLPLVLIAIAAFGVAAGVYFEKDQVPPPEVFEPTFHAGPEVPVPEVIVESEKEESTSSPRAEVPVPVSKKYKNNTYGFSVRYPARLRVEEGKIEPNTRFVVFRDPRFANAKVSIIYINDSPFSLSEAEKALGEPVNVGTKEGLKFVSGGTPFYWISASTYSLAISLTPPAAAGPNYDKFIDLTSFTF